MSRLPFLVCRILIALSRLTIRVEQLLSSQRDTILDLKSKLSDASHNLQLGLVAKHYVEDSECTPSARQDCELMSFRSATGPSHPI